jgi:hypothetical protein
MYSSVINKIEKARRYAEEQDRLTLTGITARFRGDHDNYTVSYNAGSWHCSCPFWASYGTCSHTMAAPRILEKVLPQAVSLE